MSAVLRPSPAIRRRLGLVGYGPGAVSVRQVVEDSIAVDALARLITEGIERHTTADGRIDTRDVAAHVLAEMGRSQKR